MANNIFLLISFFPRPFALTHLQRRRYFAFDMPQEPKTWCHCSECDEKGGVGDNGKPRGSPIATRFYKTHILRVQRTEANHPAAAQATSSLVEDAGAQIFTAALLDNGPDLENLPNKLWTSRAEFQTERASHITPIAQTDISSSSSVDAVISGIRSLMIQPEDPSDNPTSHPSSDEADAIATKLERLTLAGAPSGESDPRAPVDTQSTARDAPRQRHSMDKKERSQYTVKALAVLESVQVELFNCSKNLSSMSTGTDIKGARTILSNARRAVEKVTRSTPDINNKKKELAEQINNMEGRLVVLETVFSQKGPKNEPKDYPTGT